MAAAEIKAAVNEDDVVVRRATAPVAHDAGEDAEGTVPPEGCADGASFQAIPMLIERGGGHEVGAGALTSAGTSDGVTMAANSVKLTQRSPSSPPFPRSPLELSETNAPLLAAGKVSPARYCTDRALKSRYSELLSSNFRAVASALGAEKAKLLTHKQPAPIEAKGGDMKKVNDDNSQGAAWAPVEPPAPTRALGGEVPAKHLGHAADRPRPSRRGSLGAKRKSGVGPYKSIGTPRGCMPRKEATYPEDGTGAARPLDGDSKVMRRRRVACDRACHSSPPPFCPSFRARISGHSSLLGGTPARAECPSARVSCLFPF